MKIKSEIAGRLAFITGIIISIITGFLDIGGFGMLFLIALGVLVGFLNVTGAEVPRFLLATVALMLVGSIINTTIGNAGIMNVDIPKNILNTFSTFVAGAALIVALKEVFVITKDA